ncbi:MAG: ArsR/SmtB family transcription factor [Anaerolineae bacterium]
MEVELFQAEVFKALAHPTRLQILGRLRERRCCVSELAEALERSHANISQHLTTLRQANLVLAEKEGQRVWYIVMDERLFRVVELVTEIIIDHTRYVEEAF